MTETHTDTLTAAQMDTIFTTVKDSNLSATTKVTRSATLVVAASDSSTASKAQADYVCDGTADDVEIQAALDALPSTGGEIKLLEGTFTLATTLARAIDNVTLTGSGFATYIHNDATTRLISFGTQKNWVIQDIRLDYGGFEAATATHWNIINVWVDYYLDSANQIHIDNWGSDHFSVGDFPNLQKVIHDHPLTKQLDNFEEYGWTAFGGATVTFDTTTFFSGTKSLKIVSPVGGACGATKTLTSSIDMVDTALSFMVYTPDYTAIKRIDFYAYTNGVLSVLNNMDCQASKQNNKWWRFNLPYLVLNAGADLSGITSIEFYITPEAGKSVTIYIDDLRYWKNGVMTPKGAITFDFDDGDPSVPLYAKPLMDVYNYAGNWGVVIRTLSTDPIRLNAAKTMQACGWDIVNHSLNHNFDRTLVEPANEFLLAQKWLVENGFKTGARHTIIPFGLFDETTMDIFDGHMGLSRDSQYGYNSLPGISNPLKCTVIGDGRAQSVYKNLIDLAKAEKIWIIFQGHVVDPVTEELYQISQANLQYILDYCHSTGVEVLTYSQIFNRIVHGANTSYGSAIITNGTTSVNVRHNFVYAPSKIEITLTSGLGSAKSIWVSDKDVGSKGTMFTVSVDADPGVNITFDWQAVI